MNIKKNMVILLVVAFILPVLTASQSIPTAQGATPDSAQSGSIAIVLCLDVSGSMSGSIADVQAAALLILDFISDEVYIGLVTYDSYSYINVVLGPKSTNDAAMRTAINSMYAGSNTNIDAGLMDSIGLFSGGSYSEKFIVLMTDGGTNTADSGREAYAYGDASYYDSNTYLWHWENDAGSAINTAESQGICIHTVGFGGYYDSAFLQAVATGTICGVFYDAADAQELAMTFAEMANELEGWEESRTYYGTIEDGETIVVDDEYPIDDDSPFVRISVYWGDAMWEIEIIVETSDGQEFDPIDSYSEDTFAWAVYDCYGLDTIVIKIKATYLGRQVSSSDFGANAARNAEYQDYDPTGPDLAPADEDDSGIPGFNLVFLAFAAMASIAAIMLKRKR